MADTPPIPEDATLDPCENCERLVWSHREHECPEPYHLDVAQYLVQFHSATGIPVHPNTKARCVLAYKQAGLR